MDDRNNTILGWVLGAGIVALGLGSLTGHMWKAHESETFGYAVEGAAGGAGGADAGPPIEALLATADPAKGQQVFAKCAACHTVNQGGANGIGPNLWGTLGMRIAGHAGFGYSSALSGKGGTWDFATMNEWLQSPRRFAPGTTMSFAGLSSAEDRANLMAYLNTQGSNLPLPAVPAADAAAPAAGAEEAPDGGGAADPTMADGTAPTAGAAPAGPAQPAPKN
jgi:cytochrome c